MASRLFQSIILQMKEVSDRTIGIIDSTGAIIACTELSCIGEARLEAMSEVSYATEMVSLDGFTYKVVGDKNTRYDYIVFVKGDDLAAKNMCNIFSITVNSIKSLYDEKHDKSTFIKNIIMDNILPGDIYIKSRELHFVSESYRVVFLVRQTDKVDLGAIDTINNMFPDRNRDFVIHISESDIVIVKEVKPNTDGRELTKIAKSIEETLLADHQVKTAVGIGSVSNQLKDIAKSFKEAQVAIEVGGVFDTEKTIISFENLGIGRLIYQLPTTLCEMFLGEVFKRGSIDMLDNETLFTIQKFFENNLNVSETSRKLFVHRNTLVYRLEKIKKITGLDLREFDHAIVFKVALMVRKYLSSREEGNI